LEAVDLSTPFPGTSSNFRSILNDFGFFLGKEGRTGQLGTPAFSLSMPGIDVIK